MNRDREALLVRVAEAKRGLRQAPGCAPSIDLACVTLDDLARIALAHPELPPSIALPVGGGVEGALSDVAGERRRQVETEGWTAEHDDAHRDGSMALAAACYAMFASLSNRARAVATLPAGLTKTGKAVPGWAAFLEIWPWSREWWKPKSPREDLVRAGALIVAEIQRLDRAALSPRSADGNEP